MGDLRRVPAREVFMLVQAYYFHRPFVELKLGCEVWSILI